MRVEIQLRDEPFIRLYRDVEAVSHRGHVVPGKPGTVVLSQREPVQSVDFQVEDVHSLYVFDDATE